MAGSYFNNYFQQIKQMSKRREYKYTISQQAKMTHKELFELNGARAAVRSLSFVLIFAMFIYIISGNVLSPEMAVTFFLIDATMNTFRYKWFFKR